MPIVASWDGVNRQIFLDPSVANSSWSPLDLFKEYLAYRRDNHQFRGFESLIVMKGGEPKGGGKFAPRFLQLLTDRRGITTKLILPDIGPYRTTVNGELATDVPDTDPEPFNTSGLTTAAIVDYRPAEAEIISVNTGSSVTAQDKVDIANQILNSLLEGDETVAQALRLIRAEAAGTLNVSNNGTEVRIRDKDDTKDRIIANVDPNTGQRDVTATDGV